ncbi:MAG: RdgB/HAM1 family non-canonical purine NTP pyrophosphatase [Syntrophorhabdaceae bacterium]|nr:RdgB/HAM1 family non-canonical purine NTP pyrophosphatase [Syntrophorhabdaceae bacterium]
MKLVIATKSREKVTEIRSAIDPALRRFQKDIEIVPLFDMPPVLSPEETGHTFAENAKIKGLYYADKLKALCIADDSGLSVEALRGKPGVYSARFAGVNATDEQNIALLQEQLLEHPRPWRALFVCVAVAALPGGRVVAQATGAVQGEILSAPRGSAGFGYDPVFFVTSHGKTMAELSLEEKNRVSHRGAAMRSLVAEMKNIGILPT